MTAATMAATAAAVAAPAAAMAAPAAAVAAPAAVMAVAMAGKRNGWKRQPRDNGGGERTFS